MTKENKRQIFYNKLARDKIPENIAAKGVDYEVRELSDDEFEKELLKKAVEEATEVAETTSREELVKEIADLEDVIEEIRRLKGITEDELLSAKKAALDKKGGFAKHLFLVWAGDDGYRTNETTS